MNHTTKSPCIGVCEYAPLQEDDIERICRGCGRTAEEIEEWIRASEDRRKEIVKAGKKRKADEEYKKDLKVLLRISKI
jgi:predicted Fe-S protein YdhL (DUF1289 family)